MASRTVDKFPAPERDKQSAPRAASEPPGWADTQGSLAAASGLSILLVEGHQPPSLVDSNNNSICQSFQSSPAHAHLCDPFCGRAHERALSAGGAVTHYRCHAGLHCFAMPVEISRGREELVVIGGRAFLTSADYRALAERIRVGDLQDLLSSDLFKNVIFAARQDLDDLARRLKDATKDYNSHPRAVSQKLPAILPAEQDEESDASVVSVGIHSAGAVRLGGEFYEAGARAINSFAEKYGLASVALLLREKNSLMSVFATGRFKNAPLQIELGPKDARLSLMVKAGSSLALTETSRGFKPARAVVDSDKLDLTKSAELFPLVVGDEVKGALLLRDAVLDEAKRRAVSDFCRDIAMPLEVMRLRNELDQRARFTDQLQRFTERINSTAPHETYLSILRHSTELLHAERGSLLLFDEVSNELAIKAALGFHTDVTDQVRLRLGDGISGSVLQEGRPLVVRDLEQAGHTPAPAERHYKTKSFISYPITVGGRKVGVLNVTDKAGGGSYDEIDLGLLETIAPQMALALDRAEWHEKAEQFQLMSITDPLTGMLNRRYLEERLTEELKRSARESYAMSFMMIDIDDFKVYNDLNGHQAGDLALEMTAQCLKSVLRSADVASRYGGEEFCILLPQTTLEEACAIAERIRRRVERTRFPHGKAQPLGVVTVSIGVSAFSSILDTSANIIGAADRALYSAKSMGKNRVNAQTDEQPEPLTINVSKGTKQK